VNKSMDIREFCELAAASAQVVADEDGPRGAPRVVGYVGRTYQGARRAGQVCKWTVGDDSPTSIPAEPTALRRAVERGIGAFAGQGYVWLYLYEHGSTVGMNPCRVELGYTGETEPMTSGEGVGLVMGTMARAFETTLAALLDKDASMLALAETTATERAKRIVAEFVNGMESGPSELETAMPLIQDLVRAYAANTTNSQAPENPGDRIDWCITRLQGTMATLAGTISAEPSALTPERMAQLAQLVAQASSAVA
jgi:hypothetical protein